VNSINNVAAEASSGAGRAVVFAAIEHLAAPARALLSDACARAGAALVPWTARDKVRGGEWPSMLVTGLPSGRRRIPEDVCELLSKDFPRLQVLVLCDEPLKRRTMSSHGGRIVLVGTPHSVSQIASRVQMLLCARPVPREAVGFRQDRASTEERLDPRYWVGTVASSDSKAAPLLRRDGSGLTVLLSLPGAKALVTIVDRVVAALSAATPDDRTRAAVAELLGNDHAAVHLAKATEEWRLYFPWPERTASLCSPERLPSIWDFSTTFAKSPFARLPAAPGDLLVVSTAPRRALGEGDARLAEDGGPAVLGSLLGPPPGRSVATSTISGTVVELL
jgi:hypothetical protein